MKINKIFIASKNKGKIEEIKFYLGNLNIEVFSMLDTPEVPDIEETGKTFEENALIKAKAVFDIVKIPVIADDSGLEVDYLNGAPGVYSARYSGENATDEKNCEKLLLELKGAAPEKRTARFRCVLVLYDGLNERYFDGTAEGHIITNTRGNGGFGYDPLFVPSGYDKTFAELGMKEKNRISHRGKAVESFAKFMDLEAKI